MTQIFATASTVARRLRLSRPAVPISSFHLGPFTACSRLLLQPSTEAANTRDTSSSTPRIIRERAIMNYQNYAEASTSSGSGSSSRRTSTDRTAIPSSSASSVAFPVPPEQQQQQERRGSDTPGQLPELAFCHQCNAEIRPLVAPSGALTCSVCDGDFVELVSAALSFLKDV